MQRGILLFGYPGCGKGTQGKLLAALPGFRHVATGDIFRSLSPSHSLFEPVQRHVRAGNLVPDDLVMDLFFHHVGGLGLAADELLIIDGVPRNLRQVELLNARVEVTRIFMLTVDDEQVVIERMRKRAREQNREDDASELVIRHRLEVYRDETESCMQAYPRRTLTRIQGDQAIFDVHLDIVHALSKMRNVQFR